MYAIISSAMGVTVEKDRARADTAHKATLVRTRDGSELKRNAMDELDFDHIELVQFVSVPMADCAKAVLAALREGCFELVESTAFR